MLCHKTPFPRQVKHFYRTFNILFSLPHAIFSLFGVKDDNRHLICISFTPNRVVLWTFWWKFTISSVSRKENPNSQSGCDQMFFSLPIDIVLIRAGADLSVSLNNNLWITFFSNFLLSSSRSGSIVRRHQLAYHENVPQVPRID